MKTSRGMENELTSQNSKITDICSRCTRSNTVIQTKTSPGLVDHYRNLCKNLKCFIHRQNKTKLKKKKNNLTDDNKSGVKWKKSKLFKGRKSGMSNSTAFGCNQNRSKTKNSKNGIPRKDSGIPIKGIKRIYSQCQVTDFDDEVGNDTKGIIDHDLYLQIESTIMELDVGDEAKLQDVVGNGFLKEAIDRTIIWPMKKPHVFRGLRSAPKGVLLFGPPGTGKTLIGKSIASQTDWTFFNISSSSLLSKWMGESEKLVRTMFAVAKARQPSLIFIDEVDSLLGYRSPDEDGSSRRIKNEFLENMDGCSTGEQDKIMIIGATNRPQELDEAARQRFNKRLYIPLPDEASRKELLMKLLECECHSLEEEDINEIIKKTEGFSLADIKSLGQEAAMGPIKSLASNAIIHLKEDRIRPISIEDFIVALQLIKPSVTSEELEAYEAWNSKYGYSEQNNKN